MNLQKLTNNLQKMTDELNSIPGVEVTSTDKLMKERDKLRAENLQLQEGIKAARNALEDTLGLLREHPVLKGHADRIRRIHRAMHIANKALESLEVEK